MHKRLRLHNNISWYLTPLKESGKNQGTHFSNNSTIQMQVSNIRIKKRDFLFTDLLSPNRNHNASSSAMISVLSKIYSLPGSESQRTIGYRY